MSDINPDQSMLAMRIVGAIAGALVSLAYMMPKSAREAAGAGDCRRALGPGFRWPGWRGAGAMDGGERVAVAIRDPAHRIWRRPA